MTDDEIMAVARLIADGFPDQAHIDALLQDNDRWHGGWFTFRKQNPDLIPRLSTVQAQNRSLQDVDLHRARLQSANLRHCDLYNADLSEADCHSADFRNARVAKARFRHARLHLADFHKTDASGADFRGADLWGASFYGANLTEADLTETNASEAIFPSANLTKANLSRLDLRGTRLDACVLVGTDLSGTDISGANVYGISVWDVNLDGAVQRDLVITPSDQPPITVDNLEVAQFIYLLLNNRKIRDVVDTVTTKVVLILGRFTPERKVVFDGIRDELRRRDYLPVLFDFEKPSSRDINETVSTLAHMAKFILADITDARSIPQELMAIVPNLPSVPVQPLLLSSQKEYGMFEHFRRYPWVLEPFVYEDQDDVLAALPDRVIGPAEMMARRQTGR